MTLDPFLVEVIRHGLSAAAEEMSLVMIRSARSPLLREAGDLSSAIMDAEGGLAGQGRDIPIHLGAMAYTVRELLKVYPASRFREGDAVIYNLGALGGNHLNDVKIARPVYSDGRLVAFALSLAHWPDVGGTWPGSYLATAFDTFQEAIRIPPMLIADKDGLKRDVLDFILANVRDPVSCEGDLLAQLAATRAAEKRIHELCAKHGTDTFEAVLARLHDLSEAEMRAALSELPDGVYEGVDHVDEGGPDGGPARIHVRIEIRGDEATFDLSGSCDKVANFCNTTPFIARSAVAYAARILSGRDMQQNAGALRPLTIITRPGSIFEPGWNASVAAGNHETSMRIVDATFRAMQTVIPERLSAGGAATSGLMAFAEPMPDQSWRMLYEVHGGGEGARHDRDGCPATRVHLTNTSNTPTEIIEANYALRIEQQRIRRDVGGKGKFRGGDGVIRTYRVLAPSMWLTTCIERSVIPPYGLCGGEDGATYEVELERGGEKQKIPGKANLVLQQNDVVTLRSCGGGGFGKPDA
ncbi:acetophenone carboxylase delta subunit [Variibacter gotjawalensis]|uniref:Acetophenone carboxylase delta subunit n=1 Tax=Variibacter gotjawalensis TaxID=1333996 RepID=A0A0S3PZT1_9BRAD|nr:hydantoinase B/oxoprolinase family protein [Variibacter gotjawalensis]NIK47301.1 N-methylhydantoinase B [Variibacter gotjawalensis]RZS49200.1 N-methylhydantoinase B [Variibacter gotjawalensis]BAT61462.1 acetophenone carboxylase delta subunit [Variibacter gotjawalensis]